jgi:predicted lipoprotein with Yx(FWY)xxD motif
MSHPADATSRRRALLGTTAVQGRARPATAATALVVVALALAACSSSSPSTTTAAASTGNSGTAAASAGTSASTATVKTTTATGFGTILVNSAGMALYTYGPNAGGTMNTCTGTCLQAWPALTVPAGTTPTLASGVSGTLATAKQSDGTLQVTYNGMLLYTFTSDSSPGQVTGNGEAKFSVAKASSTTPATTPATTAAPSGGSQY